MYFHYLLWNTKIILVNDFTICYFAKKTCLEWTLTFSLMGTLMEINILRPDLPPRASEKPIYLLLRFGYSLFHIYSIILTIF